MPLTLASDQSPGPNAPDFTIRVTPTDPDGALAGALSDLLATYPSDGATEILMVSSVPAAGWTLVPDGSDFLITRPTPWPRNFLLTLIGRNITPFQCVSLPFQITDDPFPSPFAAAMAQARTRIAALTGATFTDAAGDLPIEEEPAVRRGVFEVMADDTAGVTGPMMALRARQTTRRYRVTVRYDARHNRKTLESDLANGDDWIIGAIEQPLFPSGVRNVWCVDASRENDGDFVRRTLTFACLYDSNLQQNT